MLLHKGKTVTELHKKIQRYENRWPLTDTAVNSWLIQSI